MFICEIWLFDWYFPQVCTSDMSKYGYLEVFQRVPSTSRLRESTVYPSSQIMRRMLRQKTSVLCQAKCQMLVLIHGFDPNLMIKKIHRVF